MIKLKLNKDPYTSFCFILIKDKAISTYSWRYVHILDEPILNYIFRINLNIHRDNGFNIVLKNVIND